jgi:hypothetical protein
MKRRKWVVGAENRKVREEKLRIQKIEDYITDDGEERKGSGRII